MWLDKLIAQLNKHTRLLWLTVAVLMCLSLSSVAVVVVELNGFTYNSDCQITISGNTTQQTQTLVELFKASYSAPDGTLTVVSSGDEKLIAPGTGGSYSFGLRNTGEAAADYKIWLESLISMENTSLPLEVRLYGRQGWIIGGEDSWEPEEKLNSVAVTQCLSPGKSDEYTLYWRWPFEQGKDEEDTFLGNLSVGQELRYSLTIHTYATTATGVARQDNVLHTVLLVSAPVVGLASLLALALLYKRKVL